MEAAAVASSVQAAVVAQLGARSAEVRAWLGRNEPLLRVAAQAIAALASREPETAPESLAARVIAALRERFAGAPELGVWFERSAGLLLLVAKAVALGVRGPGTAPTPPLPVDEPLTPAARTAANLRAIELVATQRLLTEAERAELRRYSGWGGLSIEAVVEQISTDFRPDSAGLLNEYYTPPRICRALAELVRPHLPAAGSEPLLALEPSAGIGRFVDAFEGQSLSWMACELSRPAALILRALHPDVSVHVGPFESWIADNVRRIGQRLSLVVANPPFGERGASLYLDPDPSYREVSAASYFLRRSLDLLRKGGIGAFILPTGILTGQTGPLALLRRTVLRRHHLLLAFRLPSENRAGRPTFPGASVVTDLVLFQARGFELVEVPPEDEALVEGRYYEQNPSHVLGIEDRTTSGGRERYRLIGDFESLPARPGAERPLCTACAGRPYELFAPKTAELEELPEALADAIKLARRTSRYLSLFARQTPAALRECAQLQPELAEAVKAWFAQPDEALLFVFAQASRHPELKALSAVWHAGSMVAALAAPPSYRAAFSGDADAVDDLARWLYRERRGLTDRELYAEHQKLGGRRSLAEVRMAAAAVGFVPDGEDAGGAVRLLPESDYYSGALWPRYERAERLAAQGDVKAQARAKRLLAVINPAPWTDIQVEPRTGWLPEPVLSDFTREWLRYRGFPDTEVRLRREAGRIEVLELSNRKAREEMLLLRGYLNHDLHEFSPKRTKDEKLDEVRLRYAQEVLTVWGDFIEGAPKHQADIVAVYNRLFRGFIQPAYDESPLEIPGWNPEQPLRAYQNAGVRRLLAQRGGGLFFDVGLGKTRTILATLALARQEGWAKRPVLCVPNSVVWNWSAEISQVLPDLRVVVIGSDRKLLSRGERKGQEVSETDSPAERSAKWQRFKAGLYDVALLTYSSLDRTELRLDEVTSVIHSSPAVRRGVLLAQEDELETLDKLRRKARYQTLSPRDQKKLDELSEKLSDIEQLQSPSERQAALMKLREERMAAEAIDPGERPLDPGIAWTDLGCDFLVFDESHTGKNLWRAADREGGSPRYLASPAASSRIAWQMFYRAALVRKNTGGTGILLADATPAKNSPLELLSVLSILDSRVWERLGITDSEQFISTFLKIELRWVQNADLSIEQAPCVVGFRNLDPLRDVLLRYGEFRTAAQVGLKLPTPEVSEPIVVPLDELQEYKHRYYLKKLTSLLAGTEKGAKMQALGIMTRLALVALHPDLDGRALELNNERLPRYGVAEAIKKARLDDPAKAFLLLRETKEELGWDEAATHPNPESPKIDEIASRVAKQQGCSHIIFCDVLAAQRFIQRRLVHFGVPAAKIAFLNGVATKTPLERQRIAEAFNAGKYLVVIANAVAYEGVNLQRLTCAIWHADLPWEPATLQQRNGRGWRSGNLNDSLQISYILSERSVDMRRYSLITGKRGWMVDLLESARNEANNPGAAVDLSPEEWIEFLARDKDEIAGLLEQVKAKQAERARDEVRRAAWGKLRALYARARALRSPDGAAIAERLERESAQLLGDLEKVDRSVWPFLPLTRKASEGPLLFSIGAESGAVAEGVTCLHKDQGPIEFGKVTLDGQAIYYREARRNAFRWWRMDRKELARLFGRDKEGAQLAEWTFERREPDEELVTRRGQQIALGLREWLSQNWPQASESFLEFLWQEPNDFFEGLRYAYPHNQVVPLVDREGRLLLWSGGMRPSTAASVLPMTAAGFARFRELLQLGRFAPESQGMPRACAELWWERDL